MTVMCSLDEAKRNPGVFALMYISPDYASLHPGYGAIQTHPGLQNTSMYYELRPVIRLSGCPSDIQFCSRQN